MLMKQFDFIILSSECWSHANQQQIGVKFLVFVCVPGHQYALILLQLSHEGGVRFGHSPTLLYVIKSFV